MIAVCFVLVHLIGSEDGKGRRGPDQPYRVYRGQNVIYGPLEPAAAARTFSGARAIIVGPRGSLYVRETPEEIDRKPCHEPGAR